MNFNFFVSFLGLTKILVYHSVRSEIINLDQSNPNLICDNLSNVPLSAGQATGHLYKGTTPIICGGYNGMYLCECFSFKNGTWMPEAPLNTCRGDHRSVVLKNPSNQAEDIIFVSGGTNGPLLSSVESYDGKSWDQKRFANMPEAVTSHCLVKINDSMLMSIGGFPKRRASGNTYFFDVLKNTWTKGPSIMTPRYDHSCGLMNWKNPGSGKMENVVIVVGGVDDNTNLMNSVELLYLGNYENNKAGWIIGPSLFLALMKTSIIEYQNGVILLGGLYKYNSIAFSANQNLYQLQSPLGPWTPLKQTLKDSSNSDLAFLVPDEAVKCH
jgi:hypothetical protein